MHRWKFLLTWLAYCALTSQVAFSQEDLCEPSFGYEKFILLSEDTEIGSVVLTLDTAGSADDVNLTLKDSASFAFNASSQQLYVKSQLDADTTSAEPTYRLVINCREAGKQPVEISVVIRLGDVNDNPPKFDKDHYFTDLGETMSVGQTFDSQVVATDADVSFNNKAVYYTVQDGPYSNYFQFRDPLDSVLELRTALDYETLPNMTITVVATNELSSEKLSSTALLTIRVKDEDDLNPVFTSPLYEGVILESAVMDSVVNVTPAIRAADADVTLDEPVVYSFHDAQGSQSVFQIDPDTAEVRLVRAIRPTKVSIVVQATQKDNPSRYGVAMLVITVARVNSEAPRFQSDSYEVFVSEAVPMGTTILSVSATDQDFGAAIRYSIVGDNTLFAITPDSGAINVTGTLDFETASSHTFTIMASDGNMDSTATVTVRVVDANDNTPVIPDQQLSFQAERNQGDVITTIQAQDADEGTRLTFRLINYNSLFSIDQSGTIRISADPTELTDSEYQLLVVVSDSGDPPREKSLSVTVKFPPLGVTKAPTVMAGPTDDTMAIALGVVAAVLLVIVIILLVYICRRRNQNSEQLDKARANKSPDPKGLKFKNANRGRLDHIHFQTDDSMDGYTTVQENPLKEAGAFNYGFVHTDDPENDRNMDEIHIETAVIPYREADMYNNNGEMYQHEDSSDYGDSGSLPHKHSLANGLYPDTSTESLSTTHTNSSGEAGAKRQPVANGTGVFGYTSIGTTSFSTTPFGKQLAAGGGSGGGGGGGGGGGSGSGDGANGMALSAMALDGLDPEVSVVPQEQKSELTVYF